MPDNIKCVIYHPLNFNGVIEDSIDNDMKNKLIKFINTHDRTDSGNVTELTPESLERFLSIPGYIGILHQKEKLIGTMFTILLRAEYKSPELQRHENIQLITSYTTFLCIDKNFRNKGLAMILIRAIMKAGDDRYNIQHGYYMTFDKHHDINNKIESWYRPLNIKNATNAGFVLENVSRSTDRDPSIRQKLYYRVNKPSIIPRKVSIDDYEKIAPILKNGSLYLIPTKKEFGYLCKCFDIYVVENDKLFMLFPMTSLISSTNKRVRNAQLACMIGDVLSAAIWIANEEKYDLIYGWCASDTTIDNVKNNHGLITTAVSYLEFYNTKHIIPNNQLMLPLF